MAWYRKAASIVAAPFTGGLSLVGASDKSWDATKRFMLGEKPSETALPAGYAEAAENQRAAIGALQAQIARMDPEKMAAAAEDAAMKRGAIAAAEAGAQQRAQAAGVRGYGALGAMRNAAANTAAAKANIASQASAQAAGDRLGALTAGQRLQLQGQGMILSAEQQAMQQALMEEEWRKQNAQQGALPMVLGALGTVGGAIAGGPQAAAAGGQFGYGAGQGVLTGYGY